MNVKIIVDDCFTMTFSKAIGDLFNNKSRAFNRFDFFLQH